MDFKASHTAYDSPPEWAKNAIWYQILVERFYNADHSNDPKLENIKSAWPGNLDETWQITRWTSDWYANPPHSPDKLLMQQWYDQVQGRRYGGDIQGIIDKLDYLEDLGINALYLNPINDSPSLHKYDARYYHHVDIHFGPDPEGDKKIIAQEDPADPSTWQWTSADLLFLELVEKVHARNMHIIIDFSWNHTGNEFWAWQDLVKNKNKSPYKTWYNISEFNDDQEDAELSYQGWSGVKEMPEFRKIQYSEKVSGFPYEGDLDESLKSHILKVAQRWLAPDGDPSKGIDGYRLDVADQIGMNFWRKFRQRVRHVKPDALLVGEIWWETWPDKMMDPRPYLKGDIFDSIMFYQGYRFARAFFGRNEQYAGALDMAENLRLSVSGMKRSTIDCLMMMSASHDTPRLLTSFFNKGKYKHLAKPMDDVSYKTQKPDEETYLRVKNFLVFQFTMPGAPQIWAGDEMGMWGADDPDCRKPLWWKEFDFDPETANPFEEAESIYNEVGFNDELHAFYKKIIALRKKHEVLNKGTTRFLYTDQDLLIVQRKRGNERFIIAFNNHTETINLEFIPLHLKGYDVWNDCPTERIMSLPPLSFTIIKK
ncbi:glycoside hydrolase family 13 protein [Ornithobacterium rhinotracheale]